MRVVSRSDVDCSKRLRKGNLDPTMRVCSWIISRNKSSNNTAEHYQLCVNDTAMTLLELLPRSSIAEIEDFATFVKSFHPSLQFTSRMFVGFSIERKGIQSRNQFHETNKSLRWWLKGGSFVDETC